MEAQDLDLKYRPQTIDDVVGQPEAVEVIRSWGGNVPRVVLLHGPAGCGKTTFARIVARGLGATSKLDLQEINCGTLKSPTDFARDLEVAVTAGACVGKYRVWILDEVQTLSRSKSGQEALLMILESSMPHCKFFLATTEPQRIIKPIQSRCVKVALKAIRPDELRKLVERIAAAEKVKLEPRLVDRIVDVANGCARDAVKELQKVIAIDDPAARLAAVGGVGAQKAAYDLLAALLPFQGKPNWTDVARILTDIESESAESIRLMLLSVARGMMLKGGARAALGYKVVCCFDKPLYDNGGHALLAAGCWEIVTK